MILAIDTATESVTAALGRDGRVLASACVSAERRHAETLVPMLEFLEHTSGVSLNDVGAVAVGIGPGLFTGLRVGVTTAKVIAFSLNVPVVAIPTLDLLAWPVRHTGRSIVATIDARRREVFWAVYRPVPGGVVRESEYEVGTAGDLVADLVARDEEVLLVGDGAIRYSGELERYEHAEAAGPPYQAPSIESLVELGGVRLAQEDFTSAVEVVPMYLRAPDITMASGR